MYMITGFYKHVEKDNWENGGTGECYSQHVEWSIKAETLKELVRKCEDFTNGQLCPDLIEQNRLDFQTTENAEGYEPSAAEWERFKRGEIDLYMCNYSAIVYNISDADLTVEFSSLI